MKGLSSSSEFLNSKQKRFHSFKMASSEESRDEEWIKFKGRSKVWEYFLVDKDKKKVKCKREAEPGYYH